MRGCWIEDGIHNLVMSYVIVGGGWYLWKEADVAYFISTAKESIAGPHWRKAGAPVEGAYAPQNGATGTATFALIA